MAGCIVQAEADEVPLMEVAVDLRMKYPKVRDLMFAGVLKGQKKGGYWLIERESVERFKALANLIGTAA